jgi:site-specific recombinase XerD
VVECSKFYKTRLVPIGPQLTNELCSYREKRCQLPLPKGKDSAFFATRPGNSLHYNRVGTIFRVLRQHAKIHRKDESGCPPRIHDLRHSFAVHRLVSWYREGKDVQRLLPQLSTYLGHVDISQTQHYLSMTPELLREANKRFEQYALAEVRHA